MAPLILGISAFYHDSAAAIVHGGKIIAAAQEERFTRKKHDARFPRHAINFCMGEAYIEADEIDAVAFYDNPVVTLDRVVKNFISVAPKGEAQWIEASRSILGAKFRTREMIADVLGEKRPVLFIDHHMSHTASSFFPSPFESAATLTVDGVGEHATLSIGKADNTGIELLRELKYPHSLGMLYSAFTGYCGFKINSGEYKLMGLAPYGEPKYINLIRDNLIDVKPDGSLRLNLEYFAFLDEKVMTSDKFHMLFGADPRKPESPISVRHMDIAASIQKVTEYIMLLLAREARRLTDERVLTMAGGVALNCVSNGIILREGIFDDIWIQPAAGDAGGALGAALYTSHCTFKTPRVPQKGSDSQKGSYLGPRYSSLEIKSYLDRHEYPYEHIIDNDNRAEKIAGALADGLVVGHFSGRMEFGPRALGARSILGDPRRTDMQSVMNLKIKFRESFRPFAPSVLKSHVAEYFELDRESPYMLLVASVLEKHRTKAKLKKEFEGDVEDMLKIINQPRSNLPAITHVDHTARIQTVSPDTHADFHRILQAFNNITGCPVLINTSFNVRSEPIVNTPYDAYTCFMRTGMDLLVLEDCLLWKTHQPNFEDNNDWKFDFELD